ncbi:hypothetical protein HDU91_003657 [Kappamyces sp. JEL0680]|nr:hypothetical protein HDU91_003657 [Kappamyces sp. JEL0680]
MPQIYLLHGNQLVAEFDSDVGTRATVPSWSWTQGFAALFLPVGWPNSVSGDYLSYQLFDSLQALFSTLNSLLATKSLLVAYGVGDESGSAHQATLIQMARDAAGMLSNICFAHLFSGSIQCNTKSWRFMADILNDLAQVLELIAATMDKRVFGTMVALAAAVRACVGGLESLISGVCGPASRMTLTMHFALQNNVADLSAKDGAQETLVQLLGMGLGYVLFQVLPPTAHPTQVWMVFSLFVFLHLYCNYMAISYVGLTSINHARAVVLLSLWKQNRAVPSPADVASNESILGPLLPWNRPLISVGAPLDTVSLSLLQDDPNADIHILPRNNRLEMFIRDGCSSSDILQAYLACVLHQLHPAELTVSQAQEWILEAGGLETLGEAGWALHAHDIGSLHYTYSFSRPGSKLKEE